MLDFCPVPYGEIEMSYIFGAWPVYCPVHQSYDYDYIYPYAGFGGSHTDPEHGPYLGQHWHGMHIYENCKYCANPLVATSDPSINYCPNCGRSQWHRL